MVVHGPDALLKHAFWTVMTIIIAIIIYKLRMCLKPILHNTFHKKVLDLHVHVHVDAHFSPIMVIYCTLHMCTCTCKIFDLDKFLYKLMHTEMYNVFF